MEEYNLKGNLTTIVKFIIMTIAPYLSITEAMQNQLIGVCVAIIGFILAYADARWDNTLISQNNETQEDSEDTA